MTQPRTAPSTWRVASKGRAFLAWNRPAIGEEEISEVVDTLRSGWLTTGPKAARFEAAMTSRLGVEDAFAVSSCTAALHLALLVTGVGPGDEVISPSLTFCAAVNVIAHQGAVPVLVDVEPDTLNVDPEAVRAAVGPRSRAIIAMHYGGHPCDMDTMRSIAKRFGLVLIEDAAHALGASYRGRPAGALGDLAAFSFYSNKNMTTGEGGMLVGGRDLVERARLFGRHGVDRSPWDRHGNRSPGGYDVLEPGLKYNMSDIAASIGIHQLARLEEFNRRRKAIAERYSSGFAGTPGLRLPRPAGDVDPAWHLYAVQVIPEECGLTRDLLAASLADAGVGTSVHFTPVHQLSRYRRLRQRDPLIRTERAGRQLLSLPCYPTMTDDDVEHVITAVTSAMDGVR